MTTHRKVNVPFNESERIRSEMNQMKGSPGWYFLGGVLIGPGLFAFLLFL